MYDYFKQVSIKSSCFMGGVCSVHPSVSSLYELLLYEIKEISNYLVKLNEFKIQNPSAMSFCIDILSAFMINTSFNHKKYLDLIKKLYSLKIQTKEKYIGYCAEKRLPCEILSSNLEYRDDVTINELINIVQENILNRQKGCDKAKSGLFEIVTIFARLCAINISKIKKLEPDYNEFDFELIRFFALTSAPSIKNEKIKRRIFEFSLIARKIKKKLYDLYEKNYGIKTDIKTLISHQKGHSILVSGDDIDELANLLEAIENENLSDEINVYTNGALLLAYAYPYFKNNKILKGHWGSDNAEYDFSNFPGAILITRNFVQKIDSLYRGELFSNTLIHFDKVLDLNNNYTPLVEASLKMEGFLDNEENKFVEMKYEKEKIINSVENITAEKAAIIIGRTEENTLEQYKNNPIINLNFSYEIEFLFEIIEKLKGKGIEVTLFFPQCNLMSIESVLILLGLEVNIALADCPRAFINPHITDTLKKEFNVKII